MSVVLSLPILASALHPVARSLPTLTTHRHSPTPSLPSPVLTIIFHFSCISLIFPPNEEVGLVPRTLHLPLSQSRCSVALLTPGYHPPQPTSGVRNTPLVAGFAQISCLSAW
ncbi:hypothetical protein BGZ60DRAFT_401022 [Tricladium varicosporioides]|nr:hypothetical protein BGZ60DRAFT_401022 [Hymenoscyphus varicosporioides]